MVMGLLKMTLQLMMMSKVIADLVVVGLHVRIISRAEISTKGNVGQVACACDDEFDRFVNEPRLTC